ncbi:MAG: glutamine synthetase [Acidimicrobiales bacterium]|nr:glutamine synthetase [Acidimicrobiales bacterium]MCB9392383.1 glutamine synthetase [Acidimicrobiaceae bacterium]
MSAFVPLSLDDLDAQGYDTVIVCAPDMAGRLIGKRLSPRKFAEFHERGVAVSSCTFGWGISQDIGLEVPYTGWHTGWRDFLLVADLATLRPAAWLERTAIVIADIVEEHDRSPVEITPRQILRRQIEALAADGLRADVGTELEFHLYRDGYDDLRRRGYRDRTPTTIVHADYTVQQVNAWEPFFRELRTALDASGLDVEMSQGEWGLGQWEINLTYADALDMCDRHTIFKLAVKDVATRHGLAATFMPKPTTGEVGSSCHVHLSLRDADGGHPFFDDAADDHMSTAMRHAIGGVLAHASELMTWYAPTINSYRRTNSSDFAGHGATWAFDNRTVSCRVLGTSASSLRLEWRVPGADVNPYLAVAGVIASVRDGMAGSTDPGDPSTGDAYQQQTERFPEHLGVAAEVFLASEFVGSTFGSAVAEQYGLTARYEWQQFLDAVTDWELDRYFEVI